MEISNRKMPHHATKIQIGKICLDFVDLLFMVVRLLEN